MQAVELVVQVESLPYDAICTMDTLTIAVPLVIQKLAIIRVTTFVHILAEAMLAVMFVAATEHLTMAEQVNGKSMLLVAMPLALV